MSKKNLEGVGHAKLLLKSIAPTWQERMGLSHIEIEQHFLAASSELLLGASERNTPGGVRCKHRGATTYTAFVETRWNYQLADVYFMEPSIVTWDDSTLEQILVHEYSHIALAPEQYLLDSVLEQLAGSEEMTSTDLGLLAGLYYERMEMATENMARAVWKGWPSLV